MPFSTVSLTIGTRLLPIRSPKCMVVSSDASLPSSSRKVKMTPLTPLCVYCKILVLWDFLFKKKLGTKSSKFAILIYNFEVFIGERHTCTCKSYVRDRDLCKHICWILLKKFRLNKHDPSTVLSFLFIYLVSWQLGMSEREISILLDKSPEINVKKVSPERRSELENIPEVWSRTLFTTC